MKEECLWNGLFCVVLCCCIDTSSHPLSKDLLFEMMPLTKRRRFST